MNDILELAARLGKRIAEDERGRRLAESRQALEHSLADRQLLADFEDCQHRILDLQQAGRPIEPADKRKLADLQDRVAGSTVIRNLLKAQADYLELMSHITERIEREALGVEEATAAKS
jgi:cell fate (sporulation/competence/biofilm development) regulator YlbF (YheA/YmcA/DUF963 family)